jgi:Leucine Rich repeat
LHSRTPTDWEELIVIKGKLAAHLTKWLLTGPTRSAVATCGAVVFALQGPDGATSKRDAIAALTEIGATLRYDRANQPIWIGFGEAARALDDAKLVYVAKLDTLEEIDFGPFDPSGQNNPPGRVELTQHPLVTDQGLMNLRGLTRLHVLNLTRTGVRGPGLPLLWGNKELRKLNLSSLPLGDEGLKHLDGFKSLEHLTLQNNGITGDGLVHIAGLSGLRALRFSSESINAAGLRHLSRMSYLHELYLNVPELANIDFLGRFAELRWLSLRNSSIGDAQLSVIARFTKLENLDLEDTRIGDGGLRALAGLSNLWLLNLNGTRITDAGLAELTGLSKCQQLRIMRTGVTAKGIAALSVRCPGMQVLH